MTLLVLSFQQMYICYILLPRPPKFSLHKWNPGANQTQKTNATCLEHFNLKHLEYYFLPNQDAKVAFE